MEPNIDHNLQWKIRWFYTTNTFAGYSCCTRFIVIHRAPKKWHNWKHTECHANTQRERQCVFSYVLLWSVLPSPNALRHIAQFDSSPHRKIWRRNNNQNTDRFIYSCTNLCVGCNISGYLFTSIFFRFWFFFLQKIELNSIEMNSTISLCLRIKCCILFK